MELLFDAIFKKAKILEPIMSMRKYFFKSNPDSYAETFEKKDHVHFVFYKNANIIGYAHLQLWTDKLAALRIIVIDENFRNRGFGSQLLKLCERWLSRQGIKTLVIQSRPETYKFYCRDINQSNREA